MKTNKASSPADELANLVQQRKSLETRKARAQADLDAARDARKAALADSADADLSAMSDAVRNATAELETIDGVLADLLEEAAAAEQRLTTSREAEARAAALKDLTTYADRFEAAASGLDVALKAVGKAYTALLDATPDTLVVVEMDGTAVPAAELHRPGPEGLQALQSGYTAPARPNDLARGLLAEGLAKVCPSAFAYANDQHGYRVSLDRVSGLATHPGYRHDDLTDLDLQTAREAAKHLVTDRLRARAGLIASGDAAPDLTDRVPHVPETRKRSTKTPADVQVFATTGFKFRLYPDRSPTNCSPQWVSAIPADAADLAVKAGVALRLDTPEGAKAFEQAKAHRASGRIIVHASHPDEFYDLGVIRPELTEE